MLVLVLAVVAAAMPVCQAAQCLHRLSGGAGDGAPALPGQPATALVAALGESAGSSWYQRSNWLITAVPAIAARMGISPRSEHASAGPDLPPSADDSLISRGCLLTI